MSEQKQNQNQNLPTVVVRKSAEGALKRFMTPQQKFIASRRAEQLKQFERDARAKCKVVIQPDTPGGTDGVVVNCIKADNTFTLPGMIIIDYVEGAKIGAKYVGGKFIDPDNQPNQVPKGNDQGSNPGEQQE